MKTMCPKCGSPMSFCGMTRRVTAGVPFNVDVYQCSSCNHVEEY